MSKKNMESTRELMGTSEVTDYSIRTYKNEELVYFLIQPSNISVLSEETLSARIYGQKIFEEADGGRNQYCGKKAAGKGRKLLRPHAGTDGNSKGVSADHQAS